MRALTFFFRPANNNRDIVRGSVETDYEAVFKAVAQNRHLPHRRQYCENLVANFKQKWNIADSSLMAGKLSCILRTFQAL